MIPPAIVRRLCIPKLEASAFTPTKFSSVEDKVWFTNALLQFLAKDCPLSAFSNRFYSRLSNTFGHIAHYNRQQFYEEFFLDDVGKVAFVDQLLHWQFYGDPHYTYSDVEHVVAARIRTTELLKIYRVRLKAQIENKERAQLARLKAKYDPPLPVSARAERLTAAPFAPQKQADLFDLPH